jgi:hypothetical protein
MEKKKTLNGKKVRRKKSAKKAATAKSASAVQKHRERARAQVPGPGVVSVTAAAVAAREPPRRPTAFSFWTRVPFAMIEMWLAPFARHEAPRNSDRTS